jgi:mannose-1-phosphate guanylyltransferase
MPAAFRWDDVGTWDAVGRTRAQDPSGNVAVGNVELVATTNTIAWSEQGGIVVYGVDDLVVVRTADVTFVTHRDRTAELKELLDRISPALREQNKPHG